MDVVDVMEKRRDAGLLPAGARLGRYEVVRLLSVGGMAEIYLARSEGIAGFEKQVVIKRMLPHFAMQADYVRMFLDEARLAARLDHPHIVSVHDIGEETGNYHYAMEYVRGGDLRDLLKAAARARDPVPLGVAIGIILGVCAGLDHAHNLTDGQGRSLAVVHRDVSLSNVLVSFDGAVKVTDFGVAKMQQADHRTRTGTLKGKVAYMSPEQCRGQALDRRSDVFAIGILLHELVTCRRLFGGNDNELATLQRIVTDDAPPVSRVRPGCPPALDEIVARALCRDRERRYQTARELQRDLEALVRSERLAVGASELAGYVGRMLGGPAVAAAAVASSPGDGERAPPAPIPVRSSWDGPSSDGQISAEIEIGIESAPVAAAEEPTVSRAPRRPRPAPAPGPGWDRAVRVAALALVAGAVVSIALWRRGAPPPPPVTASGSAAVAPAAAAAARADEPGAPSGAAAGPGLDPDLAAVAGAGP
ncbi:MAG: serine/threonine protein kinase, partial [Myxococcales bacterium]|nr:serine/threonine protein kinase [Myxococcales bacterium]